MYWANSGRRVISAIRRGGRKRDKRILIVNADDFGLSAGVNRGIVHAHEHGVVTSASLMVRGASAHDAVALSRSHPDLSVGIHIDLGCWHFLDGEWVEQYHVVPTDDANAVAGEVASQIERFRALTGNDPTHLDSHQHVHKKDPARSILLKAARNLNVPLRSCTPQLSYCGSYYGQTSHGLPRPGAITVEALMRILVSLPPGITELACHPALGTDVGDAIYCSEREQELRNLCDPRVATLLSQEGIEMQSFDNAAEQWWND